jgi:hypothetical protein
MSSQARTRKFLSVSPSTSREVENPVAYNATNSYVMGNALYAVKRWRFKPAMKDGKPVAIEVFAPFKVLMK